MARQRALDKAKERDERDIRRPSKRAKTSSTAGAGGGPLLRTPSESSITMGEPIPPSHHHHPRPSIAHGHSSSSSSSRPRQNTANQAPSQYSLSPLSPLSPQTPHAQAPPSRSSTLPSATPSRPSRTAAPNVGAPSQHAYPIPAIPRDPNGEPILPLVAGVITVLNFGIISLKQHFHTERYIFPIGYEISRCVFSFDLYIFLAQLDSHISGGIFRLLTRRMMQFITAKFSTAARAHGSILLRPTNQINPWCQVPQLGLGQLSFGKQT
jgi:hypothetical protein